VTCVRVGEEKVELVCAQLARQSILLIVELGFELGIA